MSDNISVEHLDVAIVGAGLSGIDAAYRVQQHFPGKRYAVLEARAAMGGTWDLFRYPGIRSDSDIFTFGFAFKPWSGDRPLAEGAEILSYIEQSAAERGIDRHIRYGTKVTRADWSSTEQRWHLDLEVTTPSGPQQRSMTAAFVYLCVGYYRYDAGYTPDFPGIDSYTGQVVHPQFWPEDLDYSGKRVVVIGSGATAVTLLPAMADTAGHVTMLQRSPTWISPLPGRDKNADRIRAALPAAMAHSLIRAKNVVRSIAIYQYCTRFPRRARRLLLGLVNRYLQDEQAVAEHFTPTYNPWEQRLCASPDGEFFRALTRGDASVVTDHIETFVPEGIRLKGGSVLEADLVVTATGLQLLPGGGIQLSLDGAEVQLGDAFVWRGAMISGVPNLSVAVGYTNASWTLRADLTARLVCKVLDYMDRKNLTSVMPVPPQGMSKRPLLGLSSGYIKRSIEDFPWQGDRGPWVIRQNYLLDRLFTLRGGLHRDLIPAPARPAVVADEQAAGVMAL
ncbi:NAD(P)/FAD-dependent oxidoreductase [Nocardia xishanensis]|uniref:flavin-containing monooxygenase n=1 Tax=Nocardia xishanensis TaxID=238964 RepID=UPI003400DE88